jgi:FkbM family methyltransferase
MEPSRLAELVMRGVIRSRTGPLQSTMVRRFFGFSRNLLASRSQHFIRYSLGASEILLPLVHELPLIRAAFPAYSTNIGYLCRYILDKYPDLHIIDIGANVGDTAAIIREHCQCPILCIEGDKHYFDILSENIRRAKLSSVEAVHALVATYSGEISGRLISGGGSAHFVEDKTLVTRATTFTQILDGFPKFRSPKLIKIDTDGFDCSILRSELKWLGEIKPAIFFEYDPSFFGGQQYSGANIFEDLSGAGYSFAMLYDNFGDYLVSVDLLRDREIIADLQNYYTGRDGKQYLDVAVFHSEDYDLAKHIRTKESERSLRFRAERSLST